MSGRGAEDAMTPDSINKSPTGHVINSHGGTGIRLVFFHKNSILSEVTSVGPESGRFISAFDSLEMASESATIGAECSNINQLSTQPLFINNNQFKPISQMNAGLSRQIIFSRLGNYWGGGTPCLFFPQFSVKWA